MREREGCDSPQKEGKDERSRRARYAIRCLTDAKWEGNRTTRMFIEWIGCGTRPTGSVFDWGTCPVREGGGGAAPAPTWIHDLLIASRPDSPPRCAGISRYGTVGRLVMAHEVQIRRTKRCGVRGQLYSKPSDAEVVEERSWGGGAVVPLPDKETDYSIVWAREMPT